MLMNNLKTFYNNNILESSENSYLYFALGDNKYAVNIKQVVEVMKLPLLDYPQKLPSNIVGLLNYNNFTINILDLRFYLDIKVQPYSISNQLLIVRTDEAIFGLIIDKIADIIVLDESQIEYLSSTPDKIIDFLYKKEEELISIINLSTVENIIKNGATSLDIDIPSLFPRDDDSRYKLVQRRQNLSEKTDFNLVTNMFSQDKFISFSLSGETYCINLKYVKEFLKNLTITKIPCDLDYIEGIIALEGDFVTIVNIKKFLNLDENINTQQDNAAEGKNSVIIIEVPDLKIGFLVDEIFSIIDIPEDLIKKNNISNKYILSETVMEDRLYTILDMKNILSDEKFFIND